ncbi:DUF6694 family lipoprotein [Pseudomonas sp. S9]|uniref:DUF6694 family lipoprotein n=1 Tax=Pseudomonas sp. S9 TaxID=686578 RepID=UPI0002556FF9|nr:DUF6694 family lipoprotein [Pseudomonas sp. S9]
MNYRILIALVSAVLLAGCGEPRLDGSSEAALKASVVKVSEKLDSTKKEEFTEALQLVALSKMDLAAVMSGKKSSDTLAVEMLTEVNGKTADELIAQANVIKAERAAKEKEQALKEISELESELAAAEKSKVELAKFTVSRSRFYQRDRKYSAIKEPIIEMTVYNGTAHPVSRAYFKGTIASPGRSIPWIVEDFNHVISGGIEPLESMDWALAPNMFSEWGKVDVPNDAVFTIEVVRLDGPGGEALFDSSGLSENQLDRLAKLKEKYSAK